MWGSGSCVFWRKIFEKKFEKYLVGIVKGSIFAPAFPIERGSRASGR